MWPLKDDFKPGDLVNQPDSDWLNTVARILNYFRGIGVRIVKTTSPSESCPWSLEIDPSVGGGGSPLSDEEELEQWPWPVSDGDEYAFPGDLEVAARADHSHFGAPAAPTIPENYTVPTNFWGEFSGASGGGAAPTTNSWVARGVTGHNATGARILAVERVYIDNSQATPNLMAVQRMWQFSRDGRLLAVSAPFEYIVSPTIGV